MSDSIESSLCEHCHETRKNHIFIYVHLDIKSHKQQYFPTDTKHLNTLEKKQTFKSKF